MLSLSFLAYMHTNVPLGFLTDCTRLEDDWSRTKHLHSESLYSTLCPPKYRKCCVVLCEMIPGHPTAIGQDQGSKETGTLKAVPILCELKTATPYRGAAAPEKLQQEMTLL